MAHPSPGSLGPSITASRSPESLGGGDPETPRAVYTTAGTIYNPQTAQSLQPPVRRGRAAKWVSNSPLSELSLLPKSALATLPLRGMNRTDTDAVPEYSPLQQNTERAASPSTRRIRDQHLQETIDEMTRRSLTARSARPQQTHDSGPTPGMTGAVGAQGVQDSDVSDENDLDHVPLRGFTVKSLHNLASYPNPSQKRAQRALLGVRRPASGSGTSNEDITRASTPLYGGPAPDQDGPPRDPALALAIPRQPLNSLDDMYRQHPDPRSRRLGSPFYADHVRPSGTDVFSDMARNQPVYGGYRTTLSQGPGAPKPLTAGPPGNRQSRSTATEPTYRAPTNSQTLHIPSTLISRDAVGSAILNSFSEHDRSLGGTPPPQGVDVESFEASRKLRELRRDSQVESKRVLKPRNLNSGVHGLDYVTDTLPSEQVRRYYPEGLPRMTEHREGSQAWMTKPDDGRGRDWTPGTWTRSEASLASRNEAVERAFYAGYREVGKSMDYVITEAERRRQQKMVGVVGDRRRAVEPPCRKITVEEANAMATEEATNSILTLVFSTLVRQIEAKCPSRGADETDEFAMAK